MTRRKPLLVLGILAVALGVGYLLLHREPVYGGKPRSYWKEHLAVFLYEEEPPNGWLARTVWQVNPWKKRTFAGLMPQENCEASFELLAQMLTESDPHFRTLVLWSYSTYYGCSSATWSVFLRMAHDPDGDVRGGAFVAMSFFREPWTPGMTEDYLGLLTGPDPLVRKDAQAWLHQEPRLHEGFVRGLQQRTLTADEARLLQELHQTLPAAPEGPRP
jgi:hypothetical protein